MARTQHVWSASFLLALGFGCADAQGDGDDTDTEPIDDASVEVPLREGAYTADAPTVTNDTCDGAFASTGLLPVTLEHVSTTEFRLVYAAASGIEPVECTVTSDTTADCTGFVQEAEGDGYTLRLDAETRSFVIVSRRSFTISWTWEMDCTGDCDPDVPFPCSFDVEGTFSR